MGWGKPSLLTSKNAIRDVKTLGGVLSCGHERYQHLMAPNNTTGHSNGWVPLVQIQPTTNTVCAQLPILRFGDHYRRGNRKCKSQRMGRHASFRTWHDYYTPWTLSSHGHLHRTYTRSRQQKSLHSWGMKDDPWITLFPTEELLEVSNYRGRKNRSSWRWGSMSLSKIPVHGLTAMYIWTPLIGPTWSAKMKTWN